MTRKKLGLGLLETFSEPCEQCAGRGVIVHHDPVTKHRIQQAPQPEIAGSRRGRGGKGNGSSNGSSTGNGSSNGNGGQNTGTQQQPQVASAPKAPSTGTHAITDDARNALAQIAARTVAAQQEQPKADAPAAVDAPASAAPVAASAPAETPETAPRSNRRGSQKRDEQKPEQRAEQNAAASTESAPDAPVSDAAGEQPLMSRQPVQGKIEARQPRERQATQRVVKEPTERQATQKVQQPERASNSRRGNGRQQAPRAEAPVAPQQEAPVVAPAATTTETVDILDIPVSKAPRAGRRMNNRDAEQILDSVLEALPEPKQPGQGRSRTSRRAGSAGAVVSAPVIED